MPVLFSRYGKLTAVALFLLAACYQAAAFAMRDTLRTSKGVLTTEIIGHCFIHLSFNKLNIYVDPIPNVADLTRLPKADLILITHDHRDHFSAQAIEYLSKPGAEVIAAKSCISKMNFGRFLSNEGQITFNDIYIKAVPAYNVGATGNSTVPFHPKGEGNGYFMVFGDKTVYISGDTDYIDEMRTFMKPHLAFITIMKPFTMDEDMYMKIIKRLQPEIIFLLHQNVNIEELVGETKRALPGVKVRLAY